MAILGELVVPMTRQSTLRSMREAVAEADLAQFAAPVAPHFPASGGRLPYPGQEPRWCGLIVRGHQILGFSVVSRPRPVYVDGPREPVTGELPLNQRP